MLEKITKEEFLDFMRKVLENESKELLRTAKEIARKPENIGKYDYIIDLYDSLKFNARIYNRAELMPEYSNVFYLENGVPLLRSAETAIHKSKKVNRNIFGYE